MSTPDSILCLFFSDENNLVYDKIKFAGKVSSESEKQLRILPLKFLGPLFLTAAVSKKRNWKIDFVESSLSLHQGRSKDIDVIQSFFILNSSINYEGGVTNLFTLIGSSYTEDIKIIYEKLTHYIHPSIIQGKIVSESILGSDFNFNEFIENELIRGNNLIEHSLGSPRKMYWVEQQKYYCVGLIERKNGVNLKVSNLYTFDENDDIRKKTLLFIPSYYVMAILPDFYERLISETLHLFGKSSVLPNIKEITLSHQEKKVIYLEEYSIDDELKVSYGVILIPENTHAKRGKNLPFYRKNLRLILDKSISLEKGIIKINSNINCVDKWGINSATELNKIMELLDKNDLNELA